MSILRFTKASALPETLDTSVMYMIPDADSDFVQFYVSNAAGTAVRRIPTKADITAMVSSAIDTVSNSIVVADITARDALSPTVVTIALVLDAEDDSTVTTGAATYVFDPSDSSWTKISEFESLDVVLDWANIQNKPSSSVAAIDQAVTDSHTHANKVLLDDLSEDLDNNLMYGGEYINPVLLSSDW